MLKSILETTEASEELYRHILSQLPDIVILHKNGIIHFINDAITVHTGFELQEMAGHNILEFVSSKDRETAKGFIEKRMNMDSKILETELDLITRHGGIIKGVVKGHVVKFKNEVFSLMVIVNNTNIKKLQNERDEMQKKMYQSSKLASIGTLAAGIAHEINNPMMILRGYIEVMGNHLRDKNLMDNEMNESINKQELAIQRIAEIVHGLRTFARMDTNITEEIDINKVIYDVLSIVEYIIQKENINLKRDIKADNTIVKGNMGRLQQVLVNLLTNAKDALETIQDKEKIIIISTENRNNRVCLSVTDNGCGIAKDQMDRLFDAFYTTKESGKGTGLGLAISYSIIKDMDGTIEVRSEPDVGTTFTIILPNTTQLVTEIQADEDLVFEKIPFKFLIVDDEEQIRDILKIFLLKCGAVQVFDAENGVAALEKLKNNVFDYIITDIKMPALSGEKLILEIVKKGIHTKIIAMTGGIVSDYSQEQRDIIKNHAFGYLKKPFTKMELYKVIKGMVSHN